jgi:hypothetical protein
MWSLANGKKVINLQKPRHNVDWFWGVVIESGLELLTRTNYNIIDQGLMTAFAERWHMETCTVHLPIGGVGITLDNFQCLLHLWIDDLFLNHGKCTRVEGVELVSIYPGMVENSVWKEFSILKGLHIRHIDLQILYEANRDLIVKEVEEKKTMEEIEMYRRRCIRAFLLYLVYCTIFSNKSQNYVDVVYLW